MMKFAFKEKVDKLLSSARLKRTGSRRAILEVLLKAGSPLTADEIVHATGNTGPNRVTIYRTLESMAEAGILHKAFIDGRSRCYEPADKCSENQCHPHFVCMGCGQTHCLTDATVPMATSMPAGFIIKRQQIRLEGLCPECNMTENKRHMHNDEK